MAHKKVTTATTHTMTVKLEDGSEAERPYALRRVPTRRTEIGGSAQPDDLRVPIAYPGEEALQVVGGWLIRRLRK
jgi:hypothetical protein